MKIKIIYEPYPKIVSSITYNLKICSDIYRDLAVT